MRLAVVSLGLLLVGLVQVGVDLDWRSLAVESVKNSVAEQNWKKSIGLVVSLVFSDQATIVD